MWVGGNQGRVHGQHRGAVAVEAVALQQGIRLCRCYSQRVVVVAAAAVSLV